MVDKRPASRKTTRQESDRVYGKNRLHNTLPEISGESSPVNKITVGGQNGT